MEVLVRALHLPATALELVAGPSSPDKRVRMQGVEPAELERRIAAALDESR